METGEAQWNEDWIDACIAESKTMKALDGIQQNAIAMCYYNIGIPFITQTLEGLGRELAEKLHNKVDEMNLGGQYNWLQKDISEVISETSKRYGVDIGGKGE